MNERAWPPVAATLIAVACGTATLSSTGCGGPAERPAAADSTPTASENPEDAKPQAAEGAAVELSAIDRAGLDALLAEQQGKVVLVDFWATWCVPCLKQLPHTGELARRHADDGLTVITVSLDEPEDAAKAAKRVAELVGDAPATHLRSSLGGGSAAMEAFEIGSGSAPHYKLFDRTGKLRQVFENDPSAERQYTTDDIDAAVAALLEEKG